VKNVEVRVTVYEGQSTLSLLYRQSDDRDTFQRFNFRGIGADVNIMIIVFHNNKAGTNNTSISMRVKFTTSKFRIIL
jgi:hypothetical protein